MFTNLITQKKTDLFLERCNPSKVTQGETDNLNRPKCIIEIEDELIPLQIKVPCIDGFTGKSTEHLRRTDIIFLPSVSENSKRNIFPNSFYEAKPGKDILRKETANQYFL